MDPLAEEKKRLEHRMAVESLLNESDSDDTDLPVAKRQQNLERKHHYRMVND
jgi:hypothetical protein